uniref:Uncharacterized protein n=1 Tax=Tanacetum cinerariifolium TaxID=118510 RepID=A0A6L2KBW6_TANCI|nr:hypothetical protein [Tanacetum cinerariifolium]
MEQSHLGIFLSKEIFEGRMVRTHNAFVHDEDCTDSKVACIAHEFKGQIPVGGNQDWSFCQSSFKCLKGFNTLFGEERWGIVFKKTGHRNQMEEIDIVTNTDELLPLGFENVDLEGEIDGSDFDNPLFPRPPPEPPDDNFDFEPDAVEEISVVMNDNDELECLDPRDEIDVSTNDENDDYFPFMFVIRIFLPYVIYSKVFPFLLSAESEDTIFDPGISV